MVLPYKISTLIYAFNEADEVLLLERTFEPNRGLWSPFGGKLKTDTGESPYACACRETAEETGMLISLKDLHLTGIVSEQGYAGESHWLMFLFEIKVRLQATPPPHREGHFEFVDRQAIPTLRLPDSDRHHIWPLFWKHRGGFFAASCQCHSDGSQDWTIEQSSPKHQ